MPKRHLIRKSFPKVRIVCIKGKRFYQVDARRAPTNGKRETFKSKTEAETRAQEICDEFSRLGVEGLNFPNSLRVMALHAESQLRPWGKTIEQATNHCVRYLTDQKLRLESKLLRECVDEWYTAKKAQTLKTLRRATLRDIGHTAALLKQLFPNKRIREIEEADIVNYIEKHPVGRRRKENIRSRFSQFFNWCIRKGYITSNPAKFEIEIDDVDVVILTATEAQEMLALAEAAYPRLVAYLALGLFAGLRPTEAQLLRWPDVNIPANQINVRKTITKVKTTRLIREMQPNLVDWLRVYGEGKTGGVTSPNFSNEIKALRADLGYAANSKNPKSKKWTQDVLRHSYASYWLPRFHNTHLLAYLMGNSVEIIKRYYENIVPNDTDLQDYWEIRPKIVEEQRANEIHQRDEEEKQEAEAQSNIGKALRGDDGHWHPLMYEGDSGKHRGRKRARAV